MKIGLLFALLAALFIGTQPIAYPRQQASAVAIIHANVIDGVSNQPLRDATVFIRDGKIEDVVPGPAQIGLSRHLDLHDQPGCRLDRHGPVRRAALDRRHLTRDAVALFERYNARHAYMTQQQSAAKDTAA